MRKLIRERVSSAHVISMLALFVSLSGWAYAASIAPKDSVNSKSVKNSSLKGKDVRADTLKGADIDEASLTTVPTAANSQLLDGADSTDFLGATAKATDSSKLDGIDSAGFLAAGATAADSSLLDGADSTDFLGATAKATDSDKLDGIDSAGFLGANGTAVNADKLDGTDSTSFEKRSDLLFATAVPVAPPNTWAFLGTTNGTVSVVDGGAGAADVTFNRTVNACAITASAQNNVYVATPGALDVDTIRVVTRDTTDASLDDTGFSVLIAC